MENERRTEMTGIIKWKQIGKTGIIVGLILLILAWLFGWIFAFIVVPLAIILLLLFAYYYLAPKNIFFTMVKDGTSIVVDKGGEIDHLLMSWGGYIFKSDRDGKQKKKEDDWMIVEGEDWHIFGGLRWIGIWPLYAVRTIEAEWDHYHTEVKDLVHHAEKQTSVWLKKDNYGTKFTENKPAEDIDGVAVSATLLFPSQVFNPFTIVSRQKYWFNLVEPVMASVLRQFIARYRWKEDLLTMVAGKGISEVQQEKGILIPVSEGDDLREELWRMVKEEITRIIGEDFVVLSNPDYGEELRVYGVSILKMGTTIINVDPSSEYRRAGTLKYTAEKEMEAKIINARATAEVAILEARARASQVGARYVGIHEELKKDDSIDPVVRSNLAADLTMRDLAGQNGTHKILDIRGIDAANGLAGAAAILEETLSRERTVQAKERPVQPQAKKDKKKAGRIFETSPGPDGLRTVYDENTKKLTFIDGNGQTIGEIEGTPEEGMKEDKEEEEEKK